MKNIFTIILMVSVTILYSQIPNYSFENWTSPNQPANWSSTNLDNPGSVVQSTDAKQGIYAIKMSVIYTPGIGSFGPTLYSADSGTSNAFFPVQSSPMALYGWCINEGIGGDGVLLTSLAESNGNVAEARGKITDTTSVYEQFAFDYIYPEDFDPDSVSINFTIEPVDTLHPGSYFIIDDLSFGPAVTGVKTVNESPVLENCAPNPANDFTNIIYSLPDYGTVNLFLCDMSGQRIKTLLSNIRQSAGRYKVPADVSDLPGGVYLYQLNVNGQTLTQKLLVIK